MITVTLNGREYRVVRLADARVVIVRRGAHWRLAAPHVASMILSGLSLPTLRAAA